VRRPEREYLLKVRAGEFSYEDLLKEVMTPSGRVHLASLLLDTLVRARNQQLRAEEIQKQISVR